MIPLKGIVPSTTRVRLRISAPRRPGFPPSRFVTLRPTIFFPTRWLASGTLTVAYQPADGASVRVEYRHDQATSDVFFGGGAAVPNRSRQDTATLGVTAWF